MLTHSPQTCPVCGHSLESVHVREEERRQVLDLPPLRLCVTEHRALTKVCPVCQSAHRATFPPSLTQPVQYGERLQALAVYWMHYQLLPFARTQQLLSDLFECSLSEGTLASILSECHQTLAPVEASIQQAITQAPIAHFDETGMRIAVQLHWRHSSRTDRLTFSASHPKRGREALQEIGILPLFEGCSVHDAWASYFQYQCSHALCNAHLLRESIGLYEQTLQPWARRRIVLLLWIKRAVERYKTAGIFPLPAAKLAAYEVYYQRLVEQGLAQNPPAAPTGKRGRTRQTPARNLRQRLSTHQSAVLAFMYDFRVPFNNNLAERDLRMVKVRQKVSGCFRSTQGASQFCRPLPSPSPHAGRGWGGAGRKQDVNLMQALQSVFARQPVYPLLA